MPVRAHRGFVTIVGSRGWWERRNVTRSAAASVGERCFKRNPRNSQGFRSARLKWAGFCHQATQNSSKIFSKQGKVVRSRSPDAANQASTVRRRSSDVCSQALAGRRRRLIARSRRLIVHGRRRVARSRRPDASRQGSVVHSRSASIGRSKEESGSSVSTGSSSDRIRTLRSLQLDLF